MTLGTGEFKYEVVNSWPNMPRHWSFGSTSDVSINSDDEIHVFSRGLHPLTVWTKTGDFITSWGEGSFSGQEHGIYVKKDGITVDSEGSIYVAELAPPDRVRKFQKI